MYICLYISLPESSHTLCFSLTFLTFILIMPHLMYIHLYIKKETHEYHESLIIQRQSSLFTVIEVTNLFCHPFFFILKKLLIGKKIIKNM